MLALMHPFAPTLFDAAFADDLRASTLCSLSKEQPGFTEHDDSYSIAARAVGVRAQDLNISLEAGVLRIIGETKTAKRTHFADFQVLLPDNFERVADIEAGTASCEDGRVTVTFPKLDAASEATPSVFKVDVQTEADAEPEMNADDSDTDASAPTRYTITLLACGIRAADLEITAAPRLLKVEGETKRTGAKVKRSFVLPRDADFEGARASHVDGCLTLTVPKKMGQVKRIPVIQAAEAECGDRETEASKWQSEWEALLEDLAEMGFCDEAANRAALTKHAGSIKLAVRELVGSRKEVLA